MANQGSSESAQGESWLHKLDRAVNIDVDWMDPNFIESMPIKFNDQTSNQIWMGTQLQDESSAERLAAVSEEIGKDGWLAVYTRMAAILCKQTVDMIKGRVLVQVSPCFAADADAMIDHAKAYDREFAAVGIPRERFCLKILSSPAGVIAMQKLTEQGIPVLGTGVFTVEQAIACSQAGCLFISPYYNELRLHEEPALWPNVEDPAVQHPFSHRIYQIADSYRRMHESTGKVQPLIKLAAFVNVREVVAAVELGCHSVTLSPKTLQELSAKEWHDDKVQFVPTRQVKPGTKDYYAALPKPSPRLQPLLESDPLKPAQPFEKARIDVDYLADGAQALEQALRADQEGKKRLDYATALFVKAEGASQAYIESVVQKKSDRL